MNDLINGEFATENRKGGEETEQQIDRRKGFFSNYAFGLIMYDDNWYSLVCRSTNASVTIMIKVLGREPHQKW